MWLTPVVGDQVRGAASRPIVIHWRIIAAVSLLAALSAWMCARVAALVASRRQVADVLRRSGSATPRERVIRRVFVTGVVALAFVLIVSVTLVGRSLMAVLDTSPGFSPGGVLTMDVAPPPAKYPDREHLTSFYAVLITDVRERLADSAVGIISELPLSGDRGRIQVRVRPDTPMHEAVMRVASTAYFDVMRIPIVAGRAFDDRDDGAVPPRIVISRSLAERMFGRDPALGRQLALAGRDQPAQIIGVVGDVKHRALDETLLPTVYLSAWQSPSYSSHLVVRSPGADSDVIAITRDAVARLDRDLPVSTGSMADIVAMSPGVPARRVLTAAFFGFSVLALLLGAIGLFGVIAHDVASRRAELALRLALGASPARILATTLQQGVWIVGASLAQGGVISFWTSRAFETTVTTSDGVDLVSVGIAAAVLVVVAAAAMLPAALRAARTDALLALRRS
jgi:predicted permease